VSAPPRDLRQITAAARGAACPACGAAPPGDRAARGTHAARLLTLPSLQGGDSWTRRASPARGLTGDTWSCNQLLRRGFPHALRYVPESARRRAIPLNGRACARKAPVTARRRGVASAGDLAAAAALALPSAVPAAWEDAA
jgi:hypothetical protein